MATLVGTQGKFKDVLVELVELDFDAIEAYNLAIEKIKSAQYKDQLKKFMQDHERHVKELNKILQDAGHSEVQGASAKKWLTKGKVYLSSMVGDDITILKAMQSNEEDTNTAYSKVNSRDDIWEEARDTLKRALSDEKRHKAWIDGILEKMG